MTYRMRPPTAVVPETVAAVENMLRQDGRMTYSMMQDSANIGSAALHPILHENLQVPKVAAHWVPHCLSDEQKEQRVNWCQFILQKFNEGESRRVYDIVTGDEGWIYQFDRRQSTNPQFGSFQVKTRRKNFGNPEASAKRWVSHFSQRLVMS